MAFFDRLKSRAFSKLKLGKAAPVRDRRTLRLARLLDRDQLPSLPPSYSVDGDLDLDETPQSNAVAQRMYLNDKYGCCVISARAHQTVRFEAREQGTVLDIPDRTVKRVYFTEGGPIDNGLVMLHSLRWWRRVGWRIRGHRYRIAGFASVNPADREAACASIFLLGGLNIGLALPLSAATELDNGETWSITSGEGSAKNSWGGHCVYVYAYEPRGLWCMTWGKRVFMTWDFFEKYTDEAYVICDDLNSWMGYPGIDIEKMRKYLDNIGDK